MRLKFTAILLSSVLAFVSYGAEINEAAGVETVQYAVHQKVVPDSFEGTAEYRSRRAVLESRLHSFQGKKLKVFTPEIFAEMLEEGVQIAELGLHIFEKLPTIAGQINQRLTSLESRVKAKNALISWRELAALMQEIKGFPEHYWNEFKFDMGHALRNCELQSQVVAAHGYTLNQSERWTEVNSRASNLDFSYNLTTEYAWVQHSLVQSIDQLVEHKFAEESDESIARAVELICAALERNGVAFKYGRFNAFKYLEPSSERVSKWISQNFLSEEITIDLDDLLIHKNLLSHYVKNLELLSEWCVVIVRCGDCIESTKTDAAYGLIGSDYVELQKDLNPHQVYTEIRTKVESIVQTALDETFAWLMTQ
ncbi:hypothetical protein [Candidatus Bodocaedibacter vickermanii]|uniref:Uncharacterized protein n=1 Tax=Candidatus Bodocaedibacter vickermanii TaxID=2741701 RepID=A0A7L9RSR2_9PROT|nr:hypothetical protein CPBP_00411 [Candidatus Paracaedibacteraceae bacterium 'Lake Konstanz']